MDQTCRIGIAGIPPGTSAAAVAARITELLPGAVFDPGGHATFRRAHYTVTFDIDADGSGVDIHLDHADGLAALKRVVTKTGWYVIDRDRNTVIDLDASKEKSAVVLSIPHPRPLPPWRRWMWRAAATAPILVLVWLGWHWTRRAPSAATSSQGPDGTAAGESPALASTSPADRAAVRTYDRRHLSDAAERLRVHMDQVKFLAPEFRGDPIVQQLLDYQEALSRFSGSTPERRVLGAERLADRSLLPVMWPDGLLPPSFATPVRNRYRFESVGVDCGHQGEALRQLDDLCGAIVYVARPLDASAGLRTYAFYTEDSRIHYSHDGSTPTRDDPTVDNTTPSGASDIPGARPDGARRVAAASKEEAGVMAHLNRVLQKALDAAGFRSLREASVAHRESDVIKDFRIFFAAEMEFTVMEVGHYAAPEKLADASNYRAVHWQPLLPGYFVQAVRQGYQFEFIPEGPTAPRYQTSQVFGTVYRSFVYAALPVEPGPAGRRSLAIFPDGVVFATSERRVPTRRDTPLGDR